MQRLARERTLVDRVVGYFSPRAGLERLRHRLMLSAATGEGGYKGGRRERRPTKRWRPAEASADADTLIDLPDLRARARDLRRNTPIATGALATNVTNVLGEGLQLQASVDHDALGIAESVADEMEREQEREFALFLESCDFTRVQHGHELAALAYMAKEESGDCFLVRRFRKDASDAYGTKVQVLEADRVCNPGRSADTDRIAGGVEVDGDGVPVAYHVTNRHPGALRAAALAWERIPARTDDGRRVVVHLYDRLRPELTRGVPYLAPVIEHLKQLGDYSDAEVTAAVISSMFTLAIETPADEEQSPPVGERGDQSLADNEVKLGTGAVISLLPGEKASSINPARPNANFDPFFVSIVRQIGVALELPFELLIKHFTASYSASRAALEMAWQFFRRRRAWLARNLYQVLYEWMMEEAVAFGRLDRPGFFEDALLRRAYCGANWIGPSRISVDPLKEANADKVDVLELRVKTREQVALERTGGDWDGKRRQLAKEERALAADDLAARPAQAPDGEDGGSDVDSDDDSEDMERRRA